MSARLLLICLLAALPACTHPIDIVGEGDILSASGDNDCLREELPCEAIAVDEYIETYTAMPRQGYQFIRWDGCDSNTAECSFNVTAEIVHDNWFKTAPPLIANFAPICADAPADSFASIQQVIFNGKGCSSSSCHGAGNPPANMSLKNADSYANTVGVNATSSNLKRIQPGDADNSYLYRKVSAKTNPGSFTIAGSPMPLTGTALKKSQLAALALWINAGAPRTGRATELNEVEQLLGLCD